MTRAMQILIFLLLVSTSFQLLQTKEELAKWKHRALAAEERL